MSLEALLGGICAEWSCHKDDANGGIVERAPLHLHVMEGKKGCAGESRLGGIGQTF
jgi:hypothetical protein